MLTSGGSVRGLPGGFTRYTASFYNSKGMSNDWQGRSPEKVKGNELVAYWAVWGLVVTGILVLINGCVS